MSPSLKNIYTTIIIMLYEYYRLTYRHTGLILEDLAALKRIFFLTLFSVFSSARTFKIFFNYFMVNWSLSSPGPIQQGWVNRRWDCWWDVFDLFHSLFASSSINKRVSILSCLVNDSKYRICRFTTMFPHSDRGLGPPGAVSEHLYFVANDNRFSSFKNWFIKLRKRSCTSSIQF